MPRVARVTLPSMLYYIVREAKRIVCGYLISQSNRITVPKFSFKESIDLGAGSALDATTGRAWGLFRSREPIPKEVLPRP